MDVELLKTVARQQLVAIQDEFDFGDGRPVQIALPITSSSAKRLWNALVEVYDELGLATASADDEVFRSLVLPGRSSQSASSIRHVLEEVGVVASVYATPG